jgi:hypothetical protein
MSLLPRCTCVQKRGYVPGDYSADCQRHASTVAWFARVKQQHQSRMAALRQEALTRPVHGGYPDVTRQQEPV